MCIGITSSFHLSFNPALFNEHFYAPLICQAVIIHKPIKPSVIG